MEYKNNIIYDAYYLIHKFNENGRSVTNMQIQKLMYFFEAYYLNLYNNADELYQCNFNAWAFGPVAIPLYTEFRKFGSNEIVLTDKEVKLGNSITEEKKKLLDQVYEAFKDCTAIELVEFTHLSDSPWSAVWEKNGSKVGYGSDTYIDKIKSRDWFKNHFVKTQ